MPHPTLRLGGICLACPIQPQHWAARASRPCSLDAALLAHVPPPPVACACASTACRRTSFVEPDHTGQHYVTMIAALQRVQTANKWPLERVFIWLECAHRGVPHPTLTRLQFALHLLCPSKSLAARPTPPGCTACAWAAGAAVANGGAAVSHIRAGAGAATRVYHSSTALHKSSRSHRSPSTPPAPTRLLPWSPRPSTRRRASHAQQSRTRCARRAANGLFAHAWAHQRSHDPPSFQANVRPAALSCMTPATRVARAAVPTCRFCCDILVPYLPAIRRGRSPLGTASRIPDHSTGSGRVRSASHICSQTAPTRCGSPLNRIRRASSRCHGSGCVAQRSRSFRVSPRAASVGTLESSGARHLRWHRTL